MPIAAMARARAMRANAFPGFVTDDVMCYHSPNRRENAEAAAWYRGAYYFITRSSLCIGAIDGSGTGSDPVRRRQGDTGVRMSGADRVAPAWRCPPRRPACRTTSPKVVSVIGGVSARVAGEAPRCSCRDTFDNET